MTASEDRIFHLEVLCGLREPYELPNPPVTDAYSAATVYFNNFMNALSSQPRCSVCNLFHEVYDD
jgi:hypothetical protein